MTGVQTCALPIWRINGWLLVVYAVLFVWSLYYGYTYWGGLGPGLDLSK